MDFCQLHVKRLSNFHTEAAESSEEGAEFNAVSANLVTWQQ